MEIIPIIIFIFISIFLNEKKREKAALNGKVKKAPKNFFENIINYYKEEMERQQKLIDFKKDKQISLKKTDEVYLPSEFTVAGIYSLGKRDFDVSVMFIGLDDADDLFLFDWGMATTV